MVSQPNHNLPMSQFEQYVLWKNSLHDPDEKSSDPENVEGETISRKPSRLQRWLYWEPSQDSWIHDFFGSSAIHGLKYVSRKKLSVIERVFWIVAFIASLCASWYMIGEVWKRYHKSPVIVTFNPTEEETSRLSFPAVTICNKNLFSKDKIMKLIEDSILQNGTEKRKTVEKLRLVHAICTSRQSFLRRMQLVRPEEYPEWDDVNKPPSQKTLDGIVKFMFDHTQPCDELLRVCSWGNVKRNCAQLFRPIITDYGKCCVFNKIPNELMSFEQDEIQGREKRERGWSYEEIQEWGKWDFENGFVIEDNLKFPFRQKQAGNTYGLSVLLDPNVDNGYCQSQDSQGVRLLLHTPADAPRISNMGTGFGLGREIFIKVFPDSTTAEQGIVVYDYEQRKCIFGMGQTLEGSNQTIDKPYTRNNCFLTCIQRHMRERCNCTLHYARRRAGYRICNPSIKSPDYRCLKKVEDIQAGNMKRHCPSCIYACNYLKYNAEHTEATLLDPADLWGDNETNQPPPWSDHKLTIVHLFMGSDMHVGKLRQKLYRPVDLIASIGGLLSLFLGFSVLAAVEILYLLTLRLCCKRFRKWQMGGNSGPGEPYLQHHLK